MRPSSFPMLAECSRFTSGPSTADADAGTARHTALSAYLGGDEAALDKLPEDEREGVLWAADYIKVHAPMSDHPLRFEEKRSFHTPTFEKITGTPDITCGNVLFDLKWRERNYEPQMACYALMLMEEGYEHVQVHILYAERKRALVTGFDRDGAEGVIAPIIARAADPNAKPVVCDYCGWCANCATCPAHLAVAQKVALAYSDAELVKEWHPHAMTPEELGVSLWIARKVLSKWCESVEFHAHRVAVQEGRTIPGTELKTKSGRTYCSDVAQAFGLAGLPQDEFLKCCDLRLNTSKKYPDKVGVINAHAALHGMKIAPAKRELLAKLEPVMKKTPETQYLKLTGEEDNNNQE